MAQSVAHWEGPWPNEWNGQPCWPSQKPRRRAKNSDGETRTRTGDTTIFSRVLYQLSYLAVVGTKG